MTVEKFDRYFMTSPIERKETLTEKDIRNFRRDVREKYGIIYYTLPSGRLQTRKYNPCRLKKIRR